MTGERRRKAQGGYPRGEETRARIIRTAVALFGERGFDGVSTRDIAAEAKVPAPSLQYYFESKEGLYAACIEDLQAAATSAIGPALDTVDELLRSEAGANRLIDAYCSVLDALADFLIGTPDAANRALFVARQRFPSDATVPRLDVRNTPGRRIHDCCSAVVARLAGGDPADDEVSLIAATINGQLLTIHLAREHLKALLGWDDFTPTRLQELKRLIRKQTTLLLKARMRERQS